MGVVRWVVVKGVSGKRGGGGCKMPLACKQHKSVGLVSSSRGVLPPSLCLAASY